MNDEQSRRQFIKGLGVLLLTGASGGFEQAFAKAAKLEQKQVKVSQWTGDDFTRGHKLRLNDLPKFSDAAEKSFDVVIVGGGIAGLTSAYYLRDRNVLLLEQYDSLGGHARGGTSRGLDYCWGSAYCDTTEGIFGQLYSELGIAPQKLPDADNSFFWEKHFVKGVSGKEASSLYKHFKRFMNDSAPSLKLLPEDDSPSGLSNSEMARLDAMPFAALLKGYPAEFVALLDSVCKSSVTGNTQQVSALTGLYLVDDLASSNYVFKGGNSAIPKGLVNAIEKSGSGRLQRGAFVWEVELSDSGATIKYTGKDGAPHTVSCKHVIIATPPMVAWRQIKNMDDATRAQLMKFKYGSYLVANCLLNKQIFKSAYDNFFGSPFAMADVTLADTPYMLSGSYKPTMGSVLTVYQPYEPGSPGRTELMIGNRQKFANSIHDQLKQFITTLDNHLEEIVLTRWGHALAIPGPGFYARLAKLAASPQGPYSLANSNYHGMPAVESAIRGARYAADRAIKSL